ncbi:MAG: [protein-PII] uridylyltransferase [Chthoniobacterales bacterium]|nr:[protein-PII] uridylyltransferase [Chthoniobacterales bacterium]
MSHHQDKVLAHAARELAAANAEEPAALLPLYQKFLKIENHRLRLRHKAGGGGREVCASRATLIDILLRNIFNLASVGQSRGAPATPLSLVALGGYGRNELNPSSDVDIMFLHANTDAEIPASVSRTIEQVLYALWDVGIKVGHSTRSLGEAIAQANAEMPTKTSMLEARHLTGDDDLYQRFRARFRKHCVDGHEEEYVVARMEDQARRHEKLGGNVYLQEPNVKRGCGGLRDYQNLLWMSNFREGALTTTHLEGTDWLSAADRRRIDLAYDFLLRVRTQLHYTNKRPTDVLYLNTQAEVARKLGYSQKVPVHRSEAFMKDYYEHTRNIFRITERVSERFATGTATTTRSLFFPRLARGKGRSERFGDFVECDGQLLVADAHLLSRRPELLMETFEHAQLRDLVLSPELTDQLSRQLRSVTREYRYAKAPREIFRRILSRKGEAARTLRMMHESDFLGSYLPEFGHLTCLVQHEYFHRYTADEHTLVCLEKLDELLETEDEKLQPYRELFRGLTNPFVLYLALLLHDTGKGVGARPHSEASALFAQGVAARLQLTSEERRTLVLLVDHHVTLSNIAQQRNIDDPATVIEFANIVKTQSNLDYLMLLTLADGQGTTARWSDWKELLVWQLYRAASAYLLDQEAFVRRSRIERDHLRDAVAAQLAPDFADEIDAHFDYLPDHYFRVCGVQEIAAHLELFRTLWRGIYAHGRSPLAPMMRWEQVEKGHTVVSICTWDRPHLLERIAGAFTVASVNILSADLFMRRDNLVLDVFRVCSRKLGPVNDPREIHLIEATLYNALQVERFDFPGLLASVRRKAAKEASEIDFPTRVSIENKSHPMSTLIQVETPDRLGLLYDLVASMGRENVDLTLARISTEKGAAVDTFYVADATTHGKITDAKRIASLQRGLHAAAVPSA